MLYMSVFSRLLIFVVFLFIINNIARPCDAGNVKKSVNDNQDDELIGEDGNSDSMEISPDISEPSSNVTLCTRRKNPQMHEIRFASPNEFPFMVAIMSSRNEYVCAGSIISNGMVLTTAQCTESSNYVLVNATKTKKDENTISLHIIKSEKFPTYTGPSSIKNVAIIYTEKLNNTLVTKINPSNRTFSQGLNDNIEAIGFGLNADVGKVKELQSVGIEARDINENEMVGYIDCIDTNVSTCFRDRGGPLIVDNELVGIITKGQDECTSQILSTYAINKRMINALPIYTVKAWLNEKLAKHSNHTDGMLETYPNKPAVRVGTIHKMTSAGEMNKITYFYAIDCVLILPTFLSYY